MSSASIKRNAFRTLLVLHIIGLALAIGVRFADYVIEYLTGHGSLQALADGRDLMGALAGRLGAPGFWVTILSGIGMIVVRYGKNIPGWVWAKVGLTFAGFVLVLVKVAPALESARRFAHESAAQGYVMPQLHDSLHQATIYGGLTFTLILLTVPVAIWKPGMQRVG